MSALLAPVQAVFHAKFVLFTLLGQQVGWGAQSRGDSSTGWDEALRYHGFATAFAAAWGLTVYSLNSHFFWWLLPVIAALLLAIPLSVLSSRSSVGRRAQASGLFLTPPETDPHAVVRGFESLLHAAEQAPPARLRGFAASVEDADVNALHIVMQGSARGARLAAPIRAQRQTLVDKVLAAGPAALASREQKLLLRQPQLMLDLHRRWLAQGARPTMRWTKRAKRKTPIMIQAGTGSPSAWSKASPVSASDSTGCVAWFDQRLTRPL